jgi:DDE superfamily endonuclease
MSREPYASAERVLWVVDNGSSHPGRASVERLEGRWANLRLVHLPVHASWLNQVEIVFSVVQRKVLTPTTSPTWPRSSSGWAPSKAAPADRRAVRLALYRADLDRVLRRLDEHDHRTNAA